MSSTTNRAGAREGERGQVLVLFAGGVLTLLVVAALAYDVGMMLLERRDSQNAADAAALAGARYIFESDCDAANGWACVKARAAAREVALANGYDDADPSEVVEIHIPAVNGRYDGLPNFVEVDIDSERASIFAGVIGRATWPVGVFAVATNDNDLTFPFSMLALSETGCKAIQISGNGEVNANGNIQSNSDGSECPGDPIGFSRTGNSDVTVNATDATCRAAGPIQDQGNDPKMAETCTLAQNSFALPDPLRNLPAPVMPGLPIDVGKVGHSLAIPDGCPGSTAEATEASPARCDPGAGTPKSTYKGKAWILHPGLYPGGIAASNEAVVYLMPGIYWIGGGGIDIGGNASIITIQTATDANANPLLATWGGGVLFYNSELPTSPAAPIVLNSNGARLKLRPFTVPIGDPNDDFNDIVIFQDRSVSIDVYDVTLNGAASEVEVRGLIYVPTGDVRLNGGSGTLTVDQVIASTYLIDGNGTINILHETDVDAIIIAAGLVD